MALKMIPIEETAETEVVSPIQNIKENKLIGSALKRPGHTMFEVNKVTGIITPATFDVSVINYNGGTRLALNVKPDCIYIQALNKKNAIKRLKRGY